MKKKFILVLAFMLFGLLTFQAGYSYKDREVKRAYKFMEFYSSNAQPIIMMDGDKIMVIDDKLFLKYHSTWADALQILNQAKTIDPQGKWLDLSRGTHPVVILK
jgi:hypothetical protein